MKDIFVIIVKGAGYIVDDDEIVASLLNNNSIALKHLINKYGRLLYGVLIKILNRPYESPEVEECFNDVLMTIWRTIQNYEKEKGEFKSYIVVIAKYKAIDYKRKLKNREAEMELREEIIKDEDIDIEDEEGFYRLLEALNERERKIFIKRYLFQEPIEKISNDLQISKEFTYKELSIGRSKIRKSLELGVEQC